MNVLQVDDVSVSYGGVRAVDSVSFTLETGEVIGLIGPNGSGKSSLLNALTGLTRCTGRVVLNGKDVPLKSPRRVHAAGITRAFQTPQIYRELTVLENVLLTSGPERGTGLLAALLLPVHVWTSERRRLERALSALELLGLVDLADTPAGRLTYGQRRWVELARAVASEPQVLLLDEPSAGLNETETDRLREVLEMIQTDELSVIVVDHKVEFIDALSDRLVFLTLGRVVAEGKPHEVWSDSQVVDAFLGKPF